MVHCIPEVEKNRCFSIVFSGNYRKTFDEEYGKVFEYLLKNQGEKTAAVFRFVEACLRNFSAFNVCEKHGFADMFLGMLAKIYPLQSEEKKPSERIIVNVLRYIDGHFAQNITVQNVAEKFGYSKNYLSYLFNKYTGMGFCDYLSRARIVAAMQRMEEDIGERNVTEIAMECGFNSMNSFYRAKHRFVARERARRGDIT
ncbi:MAG: helix-turn-helix domain-containing protein [Candidatus Scatosoma sp.]